MDWDTIRELLPHYLALILILTALLTGLQLVWPGASIWVQIGVAVLLGLAYPTAVRYLGIAPEPWT